MYDLIDRPLSALDPLDRSLLDRMRRWVQALRLVGPLSGPAPGRDAFAVAMRAIDENSRDDLTIERPCHATVGETEAVLLSLWRLVRGGRDAAARGAAALLIEPGHVDALLGAMRETVRV